MSHTAARTAGQGSEAGHYQRHRPEQTLLYRIVEQHYLLFAAFSCKRRGFCPSCGARRMAESAVLLVDEVFPEQRTTAGMQEVGHRMEQLPRVSVGLPAGMGHRVALARQDDSRRWVEWGRISRRRQGAWPFTARKLPVDGPLTGSEKRALCFLYLTNRAPCIAEDRQACPSRGQKRGRAMHWSPGVNPGRIGTGPATCPNWPQSTQSQRKRMFDLRQCRDGGSEF